MKNDKLQNEARETLKQYIKVSDTILIVIKSVSSSGMCRRMKVLDKDFNDLTYWVGQLCDISVNDQGLRVTGCGMDMTFWLADYISSSLFGSGKAGYKGNGGTCLAWRSI